MRFPRRLATFIVALSTTLALGSAAQAQSYPTRSAGPADVVVDSFGVEPLRTLAPGSELAFSLTGTPGAAVTLQIAGATAEVPMTEVRPGVYRGDYTVRLRDRMTAASLVTARLVRDGRTTTVAMDQSMVVGASSPAPAATSAARIAGFTVTAPDRIRPGDELDFTLTGRPGGQARASVEGIAKSIPLTEVRRGVYEGRYTMRRSDRIQRDLLATGYLVVNRQESSQLFERRFVEGENVYRRDGRRFNPDRRDATCASCGVVESVELVEVKGDKPNVLGTIAGGVLGGVLGNQVGGGSGKDIARIAGAIGGAYVGNRVENNMDKTTVYRVTVRLAAGSSQTVDYAADPELKIGTRVRIDGGEIVLL